MSRRLPLGLRDWGAAEIIAGLRGTCGLVNQADVERAVTEWFVDNYGNRPAFVLDYGRNALRLAFECLKAEGLDRNQVIVPALSCPALTQAIQLCGLEPVYADIADDLNTPVDSISEKIGPRTLAVVMVHAYGYPADASGLSALCQSAGVALIDDAAQSIDPASGLGTYGNFGVFSFAQSKSVVTGIRGSGGVLLVNDRRHLETIQTSYQKLPVARGRRLPWLEFLAIPHSRRLAYYLARLHQYAGGATEGPVRINGLDASIALRQLENLEDRRTRRLKQLQWYGDALQAAGVEAPQLRDWRQPRYLARLLVRLPSNERRICREALHAAGISTRLPYILPEGLTTENCPAAARAAAELLELPLPTRLTKPDVEHTVSIVASFSDYP